MILNKAELNSVKNILHTFMPNLPIWAFGSRVTGEAKQYSDLDLAIISNEPIPMNLLFKIQSAFDESDLLFKVDLVDWSRISDEFKAQIKKHYEIIQ